MRSLLNAKHDKLDLDVSKRLQQQPGASAFGTEPTEEEVATAMKAMANAKTVGPDGHPVEQLKLGLHQNQTSFLEFHLLILLIWPERSVPQQLKTRSLPYSTRRAKRRSLKITVAPRSCHVGKVLLKGVASRLRHCCEAKGLLTEEQHGFRLDCSTTDLVFVVRRLREIAWKVDLPLFMCSIDLQKAYDTVDRTLL